MARSTPRERFDAKVESHESGCLLWTAAKGLNVQGTPYGLFTYEGRLQGAHRVALMLEGIEVPRGTHVHHAPSCVSTLCVNHEHLSVVSPKQHSDEHPERRRGLNNAVKTHCPKGHPYDEANTLHYRGKRFCRECKRLSRSA